MADSGARRPDTPSAPAVDLVELLSRKVVGQPAALQFIAPYVQMCRAGLNPADRPAGIFLLLGPTGTGKTRTVEALAEILHGSARHILKIDCAEYQSDHEVAKLIGAPPGYIGHRETKPMLTPGRLLEVTSPGCDIALVLFDEIEKAAPSLTALLLGILDRATLHLGDNSVVNFEKTLIFLTSNLGAREMLKEVQPDIGFSAARPAATIATRLRAIGIAAVRKRFSPEFVNRIDVVITYQPLDREALGEILDHHIVELQRHVHTRLGPRSFEIDVSDAARARLLERGVSPEYGARELKRVIHRMLTQPLAALVADGRVDPGGRLMVDVDEDGESLSLRPEANTLSPNPELEPPVVLAIDDNGHLVEWLEHVLVPMGMTALTATSAQQAREVGASRRIDLALVDLVLPDGDGLSLALELLRLWPRLEVVLMTGLDLSPDEEALCERQDFPLLRKPFLEQDVASVVQARLLHARAVGR